MITEELKQKARDKVKAKKGLFIHMGVFVISGLFFLVINLLTLAESKTFWFYFPLIPWSVGVAIHYMVVLGIPGTDIFSTSWEEREYERELEELEWREYRKSRMRLPEHIDEEGLELIVKPKMPERRMNEGDFV